MFLFVFIYKNIQNGHYPIILKFNKKKNIHTYIIRETGCVTKLKQNEIFISPTKMNI